MEELVQSGLFRHDLWYRISAFILKIPRLDKRKEDIPLLAEYFLKGICLQLGVAKKFTQSALETLSDAQFFGNVRELKHLIVRSAVYTDSDTIDSNDLIAHFQWYS